MSSISLITATYNSSDTLLDCLKSVGGQTVIPEHVIIDGQSTDDSMKLAYNYDGHLIKIISEPDRGIYDALNKGITLVKNEIVGILNSDDFYATCYVLENVLEVFKDDSIGVCYGDLYYVDRLSSSKIRRYWRAGQCLSNSFYWGWMPPHPTFFVRREIYEKYGAFNMNLGSAADYELMLRFMQKYKVKAKYIPEVFVKMRVGGVSSESLKNRFLANRNDKRAWELNGLKPYPWTLLLKPLRKIPQWFVR